MEKLRRVATFSGYFFVVWGSTKDTDKGLVGGRILIVIQLMKRHALTQCFGSAIGTSWLVKTQCSVNGDFTYDMTVA